MKRPEKLKFRGSYDASGQPDRYFAAVPARDLDATDIALLTDEQIKDITGGPDPLYVDPAAKREPAKRTEDRAKPTAKRDRSAENARKRERGVPASPQPAAPARLDEQSERSAAVPVGATEP